MAYAIDLHRSHSHHISHSEITYEDKHLRRRVWWACFTLDILVAVMEGKPTRICKDNCSVELLRLEDFDVERPINVLGKNIFGTEDLREMAQAYMAKLFMCWSFEGRTPSSTIIEQQTCYIINTPDSGFSNEDASRIGSDYWADDAHERVSSYTDSIGIEPVTTYNADNCLRNLWISEFVVEGDSELLGIGGENGTVERKMGHASTDQRARQLYSTQR